MMILKVAILSLCFIFSFGVNAQKEQMNVSVQAETASYDPLIPQKFAVDSETQTIALINKNENTIEILNRIDSGYERTKVILVDEVAGRHDSYAIYSPQSVAIYEDHIVYLASNRDSSFVRMLTLSGEQKEEHRFGGAASAFSYDVKTKMLYIAGDNSMGYNVFAIDAKDGFEHINVANSPSFTYVKPRKADEIKKHDPFGLGLAMVAMTTVFMALIVISLVMIGLSNSLRSIKDRKAKRGEPVIKSAPIHKTVETISGEEYAAIAAALYMYNEDLHDEENTILTINKVAKVYSPWSSKMYNMNVYKR
ncbi:MAG: OadG family protein [Bacteroidales bacterium]|nr:OadG family protein [Bacteroidales bacterium]